MTSQNYREATDSELIYPRIAGSISKAALKLKIKQTTTTTTTTKERRKKNPLLREGKCHSKQQVRPNNGRKWGSNEPII